MTEKYDHTMMDTAKIWAKHATCSRLSVGCVFAKDARILVQGYNGAPSGLPHCDHTCDCENTEMRPRVDKDQIHNPDCASGPGGCKAVHAEQNAIAWAARIGVSLLGSTLYTTHQPCLICARLIVSTGVERVVYEQPYRLEEGLDLLVEAGIRVDRLDIELDLNRATTLEVSSNFEWGWGSVQRDGRYPWGSKCSFGWVSSDSTSDHGHKCDFSIEINHITHVCSCGTTEKEIEISVAKEESTLSECMYQWVDYKGNHECTRAGNHKRHRCDYCHRAIPNDSYEE